MDLQQAAFKAGAGRQALEDEMKRRQYMRELDSLGSSDPGAVDGLHANYISGGGGRGGGRSGGAGWAGTGTGTGSMQDQMLDSARSDVEQQRLKNELEDLKYQSYAGPGAHIGQERRPNEYSGSSGTARSAAAAAKSSAAYRAGLDESLNLRRNMLMQDLQREDIKNQNALQTRAMGEKFGEKPQQMLPAAGPVPVATAGHSGDAKASTQERNALSAMLTAQQMHDHAVASGDPKKVKAAADHLAKATAKFNTEQQLNGSAPDLGPGSPAAIAPPAQFGPGRIMVDHQGATPMLTNRTPAGIQAAMAEKFGNTPEQIQQFIVGEQAMQSGGADQIQKDAQVQTQRQQDEALALAAEAKRGPALLPSHVVGGYPSAATSPGYGTTMPLAGQIAGYGVTAPRKIVDGIASGISAGHAAMAEGNAKIAENQNSHREADANSKKNKGKKTNPPPAPVAALGR